MGVPRANKFEQVSSVGHQMSPGGGVYSRVIFPGEGRSLYSELPCKWGGVGGGGSYREVPCIMGNGHMASPSCRQTNIIESITFPQLHWRAVKIQKNRKYMRPKGFRVN